VVRYAVQLCRASRPDNQVAPSRIREFVSWGVGPRASLYLVLASKARAILEGRFAASIEDIQALCRPVFQHRLVRNFHAEAEGVTSQQIVEHLLETVKP
jgi:MoxR-like ATPase